MSKIIAVMNQKGGVGKSTTVINVAAGLSRKGLKCLVIDSDPQGSLTLYCWGNRLESEEGTLAGLYQDYMDGKPLDYENSIYESGLEENIDIIPGNAYTQEICNILPYSTETNKYNLVLREILAPIKDKYDVILIDCDGAFSKTTINAFGAADCVIVPLRPGSMDVYGFSDMLRKVQNVREQLNRSLCIGGVIATMVDSRSRLTKQMMDEIQRQCGTSSLLGTIPYTTKIGEAAAMKKSIYSWCPNHKAAESYGALTERIMEEVING